MVHGDCSSRGCYSMTDEAIAEIYALVRESFDGGNAIVQLQIFPFRMTPQNLARQAASPNLEFWKNIKEGYDRFELTRRPPPGTSARSTTCSTSPARHAARCRRRLPGLTGDRPGGRAGGKAGADDSASRSKLRRSPRTRPRPRPMRKRPKEQAATKARGEAIGSFRRRFGVPSAGGRRRCREGHRPDPRRAGSRPRGKRPSVDGPAQAVRPDNHRALVLGVIWAAVLALPLGGLFFGLLVVHGPGDDPARSNQFDRPELAADLATAGFAIGDDAHVRIFKREQRLELWMQADAGASRCSATYDICTYSGDLGPKLPRATGRRPRASTGSAGAAQSQLAPPPRVQHRLPQCLRPAAGPHRRV